ncbi:MAG TPA: hypothetical protein PK544_18135 [Spirochaetota bacterium]|nr:hypothetical protein [Spirochaetota bacterium]HPQ55013.1 hypothetical protein [Spirochaetota bacterium]
MNVSVFLKIKSVISIVFGLSMVLFYSFLMPIYGITLNLSGVMTTQWSGATLTGIGLICWFASKAESSDLFKGILLSLFICDSIGFIASLIGQMGGVANTLGWSTVGLWLVLALGLGYYRFISKEV